MPLCCAVSCCAVLGCGQCKPAAARCTADFLVITAQKAGLNATGEELDNLSVSDGTVHLGGKPVSRLAALLL